LLPFVNWIDPGFSQNPPGTIELVLEPPAPPPPLPESPQATSTTVSAKTDEMARIDEAK